MPENDSEDDVAMTLEEMRERLMDGALAMEDHSPKRPSPVFVALRRLFPTTKPVAVPKISGETAADLRAWKHAQATANADAVVFQVTKLEEHYNALVETPYSPQSFMGIPINKPATYIKVLKILMKHRGGLDHTPAANAEGFIVNFAAEMAKDSTRNLFGCQCSICSAFFTQEAQRFCDMLEWRSAQHTRAAQPTGDFLRPQQSPPPRATPTYAAATSLTPTTQTTEARTDAEVVELRAEVARMKEMLDSLVAKLHMTRDAAERSRRDALDDRESNRRRLETLDYQVQQLVKASQSWYANPTSEGGANTSC